VNRLWDLQVVPPIAAIGILLTALIAPLVFIAVLASTRDYRRYTLFSSSRHEGRSNLISIPVVFVL